MTLGILVVDDEPDIEDLFRQRFRAELRRGELVLHFAASAEKALESLNTGLQPEAVLVLSDINMPGMSGLDLLQCLRAKVPHVPVIMVTAYGDTENRRRALDIGAAELVTKPVDFVALKKLVHSVIEQKSAA
ncbi:Fis family transcriptional regulator [Azospirillum thiophilum]|uniref:Fis family transcriptional regulator n=1 Tax=Azospirillum thiophilum TaxID=528244 RepID=A0AAC8VX00_9PROT|nr:response regulator [Azospirillum thiophilum]ALG70805.1 Fis family transcriptional regulator [Azospirillum thiophilum]KJR65530.1 Fis family transcriptional regulator [Azospirillum thiophilum]